MATPAVPGAPKPEDLNTDAIRKQFGAPEATATGVPAPTAALATAAPTAAPATGVPAPTPGINPGAAPEQPEATAVQPATPTQPTGQTGLDGTPVQPTQPTPDGRPVQPGGTIPGNTALGQANASFQTRFGRAMTAQEQQQLASAVGYTGGDVTPEQMAQVEQFISQYQPAGGAAPGGTGTGANPAPAGSIDPNVALNQARQAFQTRFGRAMTPEEQTWIQQMSGFTSGQVTPEQMGRVTDAIARYTGNIRTPFDVTPARTPTEEERRANERLRGILDRPEMPDPNDPIIKAQQDAYELNNQRGTNRQRAALAERAAARGDINAGGFDVAQDQLIQGQGERDATFGAGLQAQELNTRRQELMQGIQMAQQYGLQEQAQRLQEQLGRLDIQLRGQLGRGQLGLGLLGLNQNDAHFYDDLGARLAQMQGNMNTDAMRILFGS